MANLCADTLRGMVVWLKDWRLLGEVLEYDAEKAALIFSWTTGTIERETKLVAAPVLPEDIEIIGPILV